MKEISEVGYASDELLAKAELLAQTLGFTLNKNAELCLFVDFHKLALKIPGFSLLSPDFSASTWSRRHSEGKKQGLIRACKPSPGVKIFDTTAGWGRDAAVLASFGAEVLMIERHPVMGCLLRDALQRQTSQDAEQLNLSLCISDAYTYLSNLKPNEYPDIIYIDPMHPERSKSALVKKDMQALQFMIGPDQDSLELVKMAISRVKQRVIVKWPQKVAGLLKTNNSIENKTVRFDIYKP